MSENESGLAKVREFLSKLTGGEGERSRLWLVGAALVILILAIRSFVTLEPGQVAVRVNNITGAQSTITTPGLVLRLPFGFHSVYVLDASPQTFSMKGDKNLDALHVRELTVRASDGSNFVFKDTTIIFQVLGDQAQGVTNDMGLGGSFKEWMRPYARSILRDEFGRESTISVSNPANFGVATTRARDRINALLTEHGVTVTKIVTPRPRFAEKYEALIEARNEAENQMAVIRSELARASTERERTLAEVDRDQNRVIQEKRAELEAALATAVSAQAETIREADTYKIQKVGEGQATLSASARKAAELRGELTAQLESRRAEINAFRTQPVERVMERLGERLKGVTISITPMAFDATPTRVQLDK